MNILYLVSYFPPNTGAAAVNTLKICEFLKQYGNNILVLALGDMGKTLTLKQSKREKQSLNLNIQYSNSIIKFPFSLIFSNFENILKFLIKYKKNFKPDIIISQYHTFHYASVAGVLLSKILNVPHVIRSHDIFRSLDTISALQRILNLIIYPPIYNSISKCNLFSVVCTELKDYLLNFKKFRNINIKVQHNGIDPDIFYPYKNQDELKEKYGCDTIISFIGSMSEDKGVHHLIQISPEILKSHKDTHLILIGDGPYKTYILNLIRKLKLNNQIHFLGIKPHNIIPFYINNSDIGIGRITEKLIWKYSIPVKCLEYMSCKKPFISTPISKDIIKGNNVGIILRRNFKKRELLNSFITLLEDKNLRLKLGENGYNKIIEKFRWEDIIHEFNNDLQRIDGNHKNIGIINKI